MNTADILAELSDDSGSEELQDHSQPGQPDISHRSTHDTKQRKFYVQNARRVLEQAQSALASLQTGPNVAWVAVEKANGLNIDLDGALQELTSEIRRLYTPRFPEMSSLVPDNLVFSRLVRILHNSPEMLLSDPNTQNQVENVATSSTALVLRMALSDARGAELSDDVIGEIDDLNGLVVALNEAKTTINEVTKPHLKVYASNILQIISLDTASGLLTATGGLAGLSSYAPSNMHNLGAPKHDGATLGARKDLFSSGYLALDPLIANVEPKYKRQAIRLVAGKVVLAARVDLAHSGRPEVTGDGNEKCKQGKAWREQIDQRLEKLGATPANSIARALPVPIDKVGKRRGGKRIRRLKEKYMPSELQKISERVAFGVEDASSSQTQGQRTSVAASSSRNHLSKRMKARISGPKAK